MKFYFEESAGFRITATDSDHCVRKSMGVVFPDETEVALTSLARWTS